MPSKKQVADQAIAQFKQYEACLMANSTAITTALENEDYTQLKTIFDNCKVPKGKQNAALEFAIECYEQSFHQW